MPVVPGLMTDQLRRLSGPQDQQGMRMVGLRNPLQIGWIYFERVGAVVLKGVVRLARIDNDAVKRA